VDGLNPHSFQTSTDGAFENRTQHEANALSSQFEQIASPLTSEICEIPLTRWDGPVFKKKLLKVLKIQ
jgi:hypothetical protein